jgi:hypothetical protein
MFIPDPDFFPSRIPDIGSWIPDIESWIRDPKTATKERGGKKFVVIPFFVSTNFTKFKIILFWNAEENNLGQFSKNYRIFYPKFFSPSSQKYGFGIQVQGSKRHRIPDPVSGIRIRNTAKIAVYLSLGLYAGEAFSSQKKAPSTSIYEIAWLFYILWVIFRIQLINKIKADPDLDLQHCR